MGKIYYSRRIEGVSVSGIINNGGSYFYTNLSVYGDGVVDCWHAVDLKGFRKEIDRGWVAPQVPCNKTFNVSGIGMFEVQEANWIYDKASFYEHIADIVKELNPELKNLHEIQENERINERYSFTAAPGTPYRKKGKFLQTTISGSHQTTVYRKDGRLCVTALSVYEDKRFRIDAEEDRLFSMEEITDMIRADILYARPIEGEWLYIPDLGDVKVRPMTDPIAKEERIKEIEQWCARTAGEEDSASRCIRAYHDYLECPTEERRERLKRLYLEVPEHERVYLGDMDTKDGDYIRIIYHPERKREV
ncbi:MAG: hypothetical protein NC092_02180 [Butyrivibrio sp.]|nr:hypothetical protein [Muribaculum sp.]MCM1551481.1 hypothetical protein [Butyrivibrio sp.]